MYKLWSWSPGDVLGSALGLITLAVMLLCLGWMSLMHWLSPPKPDLLQPSYEPDDTPAPTRRSVRPVMDQRPRIEVFTLPQNTFAF